MYRTNSRNKIMEYLKERESRTVSVSDIVSHLAEQNTPVNKTTVYRFLDSLEARGEVIKYADEQGRHSAYQLCDRSHHCGEHLHLKCLGCGQVFHLDCEFMDEIAEHIEKEHGFQISCPGSVIYGYCSRCKK